MADQKPGTDERAEGLDRLVQSHPIFESGYDTDTSVFSALGENSPSPPPSVGLPRTPASNIPVPPASQGLNFGFQATPIGTVEPKPLQDTEAVPESSKLASQTSKGSGFFGALKSIMGGGSTQRAEAPDLSQGEEKVLAKEELEDGTTATVATAPAAEDVPASLDNATGALPAGAAKTELTEPVSEFAPALESIAGPAEAADATKKFAPALTPLTGEGESVVDTGKAAVGGIVGTATELASSAVETVKQVAGYSQPTAEATATGNVLTPEDLPKSGEVHATGDGAAEIVPSGTAIAGSDAASSVEGGTPSTLGAVTNTVSYVAGAVGGVVTGLVGKVAGTGTNGGIGTDATADTDGTTATAGKEGFTDGVNATGATTATDATSTPAIEGDREATTDPVQYEVNKPATAATEATADPAAKNSARSFASARDPVQYEDESATAADAPSANGTESVSEAPKEVRLGGAKVPTSAFAEEPEPTPAAVAPTTAVKEGEPSTTKAAESSTTKAAEPSFKPAVTTATDPEIKEGNVTQDKPTAVDEGKKAGEKDKAPACGCCVVS